MLLNVFKGLALITALICKICAATTITSSPSLPTATALAKGACAANCSISLQFGGWWTWQAFTAQTTIIHTVVLVVDVEHNTTSTVTTDIVVPPSLKLVHGYGTNLAGTVTTSVLSGHSTTVLAYPTPFIDYPDGYSVKGIYNSFGTCLTTPSFTWNANELSQLTQPAVTLPPQGDQYGTLFTLTEQETTYPPSFVSSRSIDEYAWGVCNLFAVFPASAVAEALVLTTTSVSTIKDTRTTTTPTTTPTPIPPLSALPQAGTTITKPPVTTPAETFPIPTPTPTVQVTTPAVPKPNTITPSTAQVITIGSITVPGSYQPNVPSSGAPSSSPPAIIIGTQTVAIGSTAIVNGVTVVATTGSNSIPQIVYGTSTVNIAQSTSNGIGSYILSGLGGPSSSSPTQFTGGVGKSYEVGMVGLWYSFILAMLSLW